MFGRTGLSIWGNRTFYRHWRGVAHRALGDANGRSASRRPAGWIPRRQIQPHSPNRDAKPRQHIRQRGFASNLFNLKSFNLIFTIASFLCRLLIHVNLRAVAEDYEPFGEGMHEGLDIEQHRASPPFKLNLCSDSRVQAHFLRHE